jgi:hypothetical protein
VTFDVADGTVPIANLLVPEAPIASPIDYGFGRGHVAAGGYSLSAIQTLLRSGADAGWSATTGFSTRSAGSLPGGGLGFVVNDDGSLTIGFAVKGDVNLDGIVDILDISDFLVSGYFNAGGYIPPPASRPRMSADVRSATDAAFAALWAELPALHSATGKRGRPVAAGVSRTSPSAM